MGLAGPRSVEIPLDAPAFAAFCALHSPKRLLQRETLSGCGLSSASHSRPFDVAPNLSLA